MHPVCQVPYVSHQRGAKQGWIQDFGQGAQWSFGPQGTLSQEFAQNKVFPFFPC